MGMVTAPGRGGTEFTITTVSAQAHKVSSLGMSDALKMS